MSKIQGAARYIRSDIEPFDQKNDMLKRPLWDERVIDLGWDIKHMPFLNPLLVRTDDLFGYDKQKDPSHFWAGKAFRLFDLGRYDGLV